MSALQAISCVELSTVSLPREIVREATGILPEVLFIRRYKLYCNFNDIRVRGFILDGAPFNAPALSVQKRCISSTVSQAFLDDRC